MILLLALGLTGLFLALAVAAAVLSGAIRATDPSVARSLAAIGTVNTGPTDPKLQQLGRPFRQRVLDPTVTYLALAGRRLTPEHRLRSIHRRLDLAGNPQDWDADRILGLQVLCGALGVPLGALAAPALGAGVAAAVALAVLTGVLGWFVPRMWLYQVGYNRMEVIRNTLPDALDLLTISMEAGLAFDAALAQVARKSEGPLAMEFYRVLQEIQIGTDRVEAMRGLGERTQVAELTSFVGAMVQADSFGVPISTLLRVQSRELRVKRSQRAEEAAQKVPVKILFPLVFCILPSLFIVVIGPAAITIVTSFAGGR